MAFADRKEVEYRFLSFDEYVQDEKKWFKVNSFSIFDKPDVEFRFKPTTKIVNGFQVPTPLYKEPEDGFNCFYPVLTADELACSDVYMRCRDKIRFERGLCFDGKEGVIMTAKAMLGIDPNK
jgi:hypothetical protein